MVLFIILYKAVLTFESVDEIPETVPMKPLGRTFKRFHCFGNLKNEVWCKSLICKTPRFMRYLKWECLQNICGLESTLSRGDDDK